MTITFPLTLPSGGRRTVEWWYETVVAESISPFTFQSQVIQHAGERWAGIVRLAPMRRDTAAAWVAALTALRGKLGTFYLGHPDGAAPRGTPQGTPLVNGGGQTGTVLVTDGWTPNATGLLLAGDWIQLGSGAMRRIYRVLTDVNADTTGAAVIDLFPRLRESPADNEPIVYTNTAGVFRLRDNRVEESIDVARLYGLEFGFVEAL